MEIDLIKIEEFKNAVGKFPTGICVVTTSYQSELFGFTANSFTSVSLTPPLVSFCLNKNSFSLKSFLQSEYFAINILAENQSHLAQNFAQPKQDKFANIEYNLSENNLPILAGIISVLECKKYKEFDCGDHIIFVGQVVSAATDEQLSPLLYYKKTYRGV